MIYDSEGRGIPRSHKLPDLEEQERGGRSTPEFDTIERREWYTRRQMDHMDGRWKNLTRRDHVASASGSHL